MNTGGEAGEQLVRMSLNGVEVAAKITGTGAKHLAVLLYTILKKQSKSKGAVRLSSMLRSNKELKVFTVRQSDLKTFSKEAKRYGVLYCALKGRRKSPDGLVDIMVRAEDAAKINRIVERYELAEVDKVSIQNEIVDDRKDKTSRKVETGKSIQRGEKQQEPELTREESNRAETFLDELMGKEKEETSQKKEGKTLGERRGQTNARLSEPISTKQKNFEITSSNNGKGGRRSVREELEQIRKSREKEEKRNKAKKPRQQKKRRQPGQKAVTHRQLKPKRRHKDER